MLRDSILSIASITDDMDRFLRRRIRRTNSSEESRRWTDESRHDDDDDVPRDVRNIATGHRLLRGSSNSCVPRYVNTSVQLQIMYYMKLI